MNAHSAFSICANVRPRLPTANPGEQPDQPGEEEQRTGEPNGKAHPDLSTGRGMQHVLVFVSLVTGGKVQVANCQCNSNKNHIDILN